MKSLGDFDLSTVIYGKFTTFRPSTGAAYTLAGTPALSVYKDNSTTQSTTGVTLTADFDAVTGLNHFAIDTSADGTFYSSGSFFDIVITTGTVDSVSVVGAVVASFTLRKNSALKPTTAARTLDVSATGEAGVDWANVGSPTTTLALTGTTIATTQKVDIETIKTNPVVNAGTVTFPTTATLASTTNITAGTITTATNVTTVNGLASGVITATSIAADAITAAKIADNAIDRATFAADTGLQSIRSNTAQAGASTSITLDASASATTDFYKYDLVYLTGGTGVGQYRLITAYNGSTKVATVTPAWATNPASDSTFAVVPRGMADLEAILAVAVSTSTAQLGVNVVNFGGSAGTFASGRPEVNTSHFGGTAGTFASGRPEVNMTHIRGTASAGAAGYVGIDWGNVTAQSTSVNLSATTVNLVNTATTLTNLPAITAGWLTATGIAADAITAAKIADGAIDRATFAADTGLQNIRANTAQAGGGTTITLDASASATTDYYKNDLIYITGGTGAGQSRFCTAYNGTTKVATVNSAWATNPDNTSTFAIIPFDSIPGASAPTAAQVATAVFTDLTAGSDFSTVGSFGKLVKDYLDAAVSSRMATFTLPTNFSALAITAGGIVSANTTQIGGSATPVTNIGIVFNTDFAANYNTTLDKWNVNVTHWDATTAATAQVLSDVRLIMGNSVTNNGTADFDLLDAAISSRMATYAQPTGFLAATFPTTVASTTNITAGTITTVSGNVTGNVGGNVTGTIGGLTAAALKDFFDTNSTTTYASAVAGSVVKEIADNAGGSGLTVQGIVDGVLDEMIANHLDAGSVGAKINSAASAGDPMQNDPADYDADTLGGYIARIGSGEVTFSGPVIEQDEPIEVIQGDDYKIADGRSFNWTFDVSPDLTGATVVMRIQTPTVTVLTATVSGAGTAAQIVKFEMTSTQTAAFDVKTYAWDIQCTLSNSDVITPKQGRMLVRSQVVG